MNTKVIRPNFTKLDLELTALAKYDMNCIPLIHLIGQISSDIITSLSSGFMNVAPDVRDIFFILPTLFPHSACSLQTVASSHPEVSMADREIFIKCDSSSRHETSLGAEAPIAWQPSGTVQRGFFTSVPNAAR